MSFHLFNVNKMHACLIIGLDTCYTHKTEIVKSEDSVGGSATIGSRRSYCNQTGEKTINTLAIPAIKSSYTEWPSKPGSHTPTMHLRHGHWYCLGYCSDMRTEVAGNIGHPSLYRRCAYEVDSSSTLQACRR